MRWKIESWRADNEEQYYGLSKDEVNGILNSYEDAIDEIEGLRKALEEIADFNNPTGEDGREMVEIARSALGKEQTS